MVDVKNLSRFSARAIESGPAPSRSGRKDPHDADLERRIDDELSRRPDLERFVRRLADESELDISEEPEAEDLLDDLEQYLQRLRGEDEDEYL